MSYPNEGQSPSGPQENGGHTQQTPRANYGGNTPPSRPSGQQSPYSNYGGNNAPSPQQSTYANYGTQENPFYGLHQPYGGGEQPNAHSGHFPAGSSPQQFFTPPGLHGGQQVFLNPRATGNVSGNRAVLISVIVVVVVVILMTCAVFWVLFRWDPKSYYQERYSLAPSDIMDVEDMPTEMVSNIPDDVKMSLAACANLPLSDFGIEEQVPHCLVGPRSSDNDYSNNQGLQSVYYLSTAEQVERAFYENAHPYNNDFAKWVTRVYPKDIEESIIAVHAPGPAIAKDVVLFYLVKKIALDKAIVYQFDGVWVEDLTNFLEKYGLADQTIRDRILAEAVNLENMPEQMVANIPDSLKQKLAYCGIGPIGSDMIKDRGYYCTVLNRDFRSEGLKFVNYLDTAEQVEIAFSNYDKKYDDDNDYQTRVYYIGNDRKGAIALHTRTDLMSNRTWEYYLVKYIAPDRAIFYEFQFISEKKFVEVIEEYELVDQATIDQIAADLS